MAASFPPLSYGALLFPGFEILDIAGPLEALNTLSRMPGQEGMTLSVLARTKYPITPTPPNGQGENFAGAQQWVPTHTLDDAPDIDVLLVPGGFGSLPPADTTAEVDFIKKVFPSLKYLFTICTGAALAAQGA